ncbi:MAG: hypothetical protein ACT4NU_11175 [Chromatiales bacterium]
MALQLVVNNTGGHLHRRPCLPGEAPYFDGLLERTRAQLRDDLVYYQRKLKDLKQSEPESLTELKSLYRSREQYILRLLRTMGDRLQAV